MEDSHREFLELLVYLFLRYNKFDEAFAVAQLLQCTCPNDPFVQLSFAFVALQTNNPNDALLAIQTSENFPKSQDLQKLLFLLKSKILWALGRDAEARSAYTRFLGIQERDLRLAVACSNPKTKVLS